MAFKAVVFNTVTNLINVVSALDPSLVDASVSLPVATGNSVSNGQLVSLINNAGTIQVVLASAINTPTQSARAAVGFVLAPASAGQTAQVFLDGTYITQVPGASFSSIGALVYLSDATPGGTSLTPPLPTRIWQAATAYAAGDIIQDSNGNWETTNAPGGTTGATEPNPTPPGGAGAWSTVYNGTTVDGTVTWTMSFAPLEQIVGQIVNFDGTNCTIIFHPFLNIGDVSSVGLQMPADFSVSNSPITTSGTFFVQWNNQNANTGFFGPASGSPGTPGWRKIVATGSGSDFATTTAGFFLAGPVSGPNASPTLRLITVTDLFGGTGASNTTFLRGDGTWATPADVDFYQTVQAAGVSKPQEPRLNFLSPIAVVDNPGNTSTDVSVPVFGASGVSHSSGLVPDPGSVAGTVRFLREDATFQYAVSPQKSDHPGLTGSLGPVVLVASVPATGMFRVSIYEECTVPGASGGGQPFGSGVFGSGVFQMGDDSVQTSVSWTDGVTTRSGTPVPAPLDLANTNAASGDLTIYAVIGSSITFTSALAATGAPQYDVFVRLEPLS